MKQNRTPWRRVAAIAATVALACGLSGCGDDDDDAAPADVGEEMVIEVELADFEFRGLPDRVPVGTRLTVTNVAPTEMHELVLIRIVDGETRSIDELLALPDEELDGVIEEMPEMVLLAAPGGPQIDAVGDGVLRNPGRYVAICGIPTGVDPDEFMAAAAASEGGPPQIDGGPPHFVHGMVAELVVE
jgi:hypothetical protein